MRLPFKLAEFAPRVLWASRQARDVWEPRIQAVSQGWIEAERQSVALGRRRSALQHVSPEALPDLMVWAARHRLTAIPLAQVKRVIGYQSASAALAAGDQFDYKVAITEPEHAAAWTEAWAKSDDNKIGELLDTPFCCRKFFETIWKQERWFDTTWPMHAFRRNEGGWGTPTPEMKGLNMLWRWLGVRPVSHLPCSSDCYNSKRLADTMRGVVPLQAQIWMEEILSWPVRYTSYAGQAEITTPILRMNVPTDALATPVEIRYMGTGYPIEGASGIGFPFKIQAAAQPLKLVRNKQHYAYNGFLTQQGQDEAHAALLAACDQWFARVLDLGCGDGTLLNKTNARIQAGIESDPKRANIARQNGVSVYTGDCTDENLVFEVIGIEQPDLIIAQRKRNPPETLSDYKCHVLSYDYEGGQPKLYDFR